MITTAMKVTLSLLYYIGIPAIAAFTAVSLIFPVVAIVVVHTVDKLLDKLEERIGRL